jgi:hypothetical protein
MADCSYHPGKEAVGACISCGKMVCVACRTELQEKVYCQPCANKLFVAKSDVQPAKVEPAPVQTGVSGAWWLLVILPFFFGGWSWIGGLIAWAATKSRDPKKAHSLLIWGIILSVISIVITTIIIVLFTLGFLSMEGLDLE